MDKIVEALSKLLPQDKVKDFTAAVSEHLSEARKEMEAEFNTKLQEAYSELSKELRESEKVAYEGYAVAGGIIQDLRQRLDTQRSEFETALEEGYEEAFQMLQAEKGKNSSLESELYEEYDKKLGEMKDYMVEKIDQFLQLKGQEIYEQARRDIINDPRMVEHKVTLDKIVNICGEYITDEDYALATSSKLEESNKAIQDLQGKVRLLEAKNIRVSTENNKLNEQVRDMNHTLTESNKHLVTEERKEKTKKSEKVQGSGNKVTDRIIAEFTEPVKKNAEGKEPDMTLVESIDPAFLHAQKVLAGVVSE